MPKNSAFSSENGSCGVSSNVVTSCPAAWQVTPPCTTSPGALHGVEFPASLISTPRSCSSATRYKATLEENGFSGRPAKFCGAARYIDPVSSCSRSGLLMRTFATFEASGQFAGCFVPRLTPDSSWFSSWASLAGSSPCSCGQDCRPSAALGDSCTPAGNVTVVSRTSASASPTGFSVVSCGTCNATFRPVGVLPASPSGLTVTVGEKSSFSQPSSSGSDASLVLNTPGSRHESTPSVAVRDTPHDVGFVNNGNNGACVGQPPFASVFFSASRGEPLPAAYGPIGPSSSSSPSRKPQPGSSRG